MKTHLIGPVYRVTPVFESYPLSSTVTDSLIDLGTPILAEIQFSNFQPFNLILVEIKESKWCCYSRPFNKIEFFD